MLRAYIDLTVDTFLTLNPDEIMGRLSSAHPFDLEMNQRDAWQYQIQHLQKELNNFTEGRLFFEFSIPRMGKRADCIILTEGCVQFEATTNS